MSASRKLPPLEIRAGRVDAGEGAILMQAMREEIAVLYDGLELDSPQMPAAGPAELSPPHGAFLVGWLEGKPLPRPLP